MQFLEEGKEIIISLVVNRESLFFVLNSAVDMRTSRFGSYETRRASRHEGKYDRDHSLSSCSNDKLHSRKVLAKYCFHFNRVSTLRLVYSSDFSRFIPNALKVRYKKN